MEQFDDAVNLVRMSIASAVLSGDSTITVSDASDLSGATAPFNALVYKGRDPFTAKASSEIEFVRITDFDTGTGVLTVTRGQEGTTARAFATSDRVEIVFSANTIERVQNVVNVNSRDNSTIPLYANLGFQENNGEFRRVTAKQLNEYIKRVYDTDYSAYSMTWDGTSSTALTAGYIDNSLKTITWAGTSSPSLTIT